jgi:hypothetical protein
VNDKLVIRIVATGLLVIVIAIIVAILVTLVSVSVTADQRTMLITLLGSLGTTALGGAAALLASTHAAPDAPLPPPHTEGIDTSGGAS